MNKKGLTVIITGLLLLMLAACDIFSDSGDDSVRTVISTEKPLPPTGLGGEFSVSLPDATYPLPVVDNAANHDDSSKKMLLSENPIVRVLYSFESIWSLNLDGWQNGDSEKGATTSGKSADGKVTDFSNEKISNSSVWEANIKYVENVTRDRTEDEALKAYYDDRRGKVYSILDGFGPLRDEYVILTGAKTDIDYTSDSSFDVNSSSTVYTADDGDSNERNYGLGSDYSTTSLAGLCDLVNILRWEVPASTSPTKYFYSSPRPWRMNSKGQVIYKDNDGDGDVDFDDFVTMTTSDGSKRYFPVYDSNVSVIPAMLINRAKYDTDAYNADSASYKHSINYGRAKDGGYPSGHTNAAYLSAMGFAYGLPERFSEFLTRAADFGENRIITGMHSPLDVIGGRIQAQAVAAYALNNPLYATRVAAAYGDAGNYFGALASAAGMSLFDYTHYNDKSDWADHDANKALYREKLTYGLPRTGVSGLSPIVPEGAEALLTTRFPYLTSNQIREILYTTEIESGYEFLDNSNGWGRLDYVTAADGYGAFRGDVTVDMDETQGRFNSHDFWRNNISGTGLLTKKGTGSLTLTGDNNYSGGTLLIDGTLEADSETAFGTGDLYVEDGTLVVSSDSALDIAQNLTMDDGTLSIELDGTSSQLDIELLLYIESDSTLDLDLSSNPVTTATTYTLATAGAIKGRFGNVTVTSGYSADVNYSNNIITATITPVK